MYVLQEVFHLPDDALIVTPDRRRGRFLLHEIMLAGNFGQYDQRLANTHTQFARNLQRLKRDLRFLAYFPSESLSEPIFRLYHFFWRLCHRP